MLKYVDHLNLVFHLIVYFSIVIDEITLELFIGSQIKITRLFFLNKIIENKIGFDPSNFKLLEYKECNK